MPLSEDQIRILVRVAKEELGPDASPEEVIRAVRLAVDKLEHEGPRHFQLEPRGNLLAICIAPVASKASAVLSTALQDTDCRIMERFERTLANFHVVLAVVDTSNCQSDFAALREKLATAGNTAGVRIILQPEVTLQKQ
ncbi:MAG: hypothetical protein ABH878_00790 [bacterium]